MKHLLVRNITIFLLLLGTEIIIALFVHDNFIRPFIGDMLVVMLLFYFVRIFYTKKTLPVIGGVLLFSYGVEMLQFFNIIEKLNINNPALQIMIGSVFDWKDIFSYTLGACLLIFFYRKQIFLNK